VLSSGIFTGLNKLEELGHKEMRFTIEEDMGHDMAKSLCRKMEQLAAFEHKKKSSTTNRIVD
jgi:outer membrane lipopolysaccharide assembly protein LptE/RlpB